LCFIALVLCFIVLVLCFIVVVLCFIVVVLCYPNWGFSVLFPSVVRQMPGYNSQRHGTARTSQFSVLCILCAVCM
jgi:hypothetical protein